MFVCLCNGVTDSQIKQAIREGCDSLKKIQACTGAMTQCCKCCNQCKELLVTETLTEPVDDRLSLLAPLL